MALEIIRQDITKVAADAIVNTAHNRPIVGIGIDRAIYQAAGKSVLLAARAKIGELEFGEVGITPAFNLKAKYIIHAVGPIWQGGFNNEFEILRSCYKKSLDLAAEKNCSSIAFPLISTGNNGFPRESAMLMATATIQNFLATHDMKVLLVIFGQKTFEMAQKFFETIAVQIDEQTEKQILYREYFGKELRVVRSKNRFFKDMRYEKVSEILSHWGIGFREKILEHIERANKKNSDIYKAANVSRKVFSDIVNYKKSHRPSKNTVLGLVVALELSLEDALDLLSRAGYMLSNNNPVDMIVGNALINKKFDVSEINDELYNKELEMIGSKY